MKHTMIDCYGASQYKLNDPIIVNDALNFMANYLGVKPVSPPILVPYYYGEDDEDSGMSAFLFLKGGHITIHTFPKRECYFLDIVYDGFFEADKVVNFLEREFPFDRKSSKVVTVDRRIKEDSVTPTTKEDFGPHVLAKIKVEKKIGMEEISDFLEKIIPSINMHPITRALVIKDNPNTPTYLSAMILIAESHLGIHYNLLDNILYFDLFSCAMFDSSGLSKTLTDTFGSLLSYSITVRGTKYDERRATKLDNQMKHSNRLWTKEK